MVGVMRFRCADGQTARNKVRRVFRRWGRKLRRGKRKAFIRLRNWACRASSGTFAAFPSEGKLRIMAEAQTRGYVLAWKKQPWQGTRRGRYARKARKVSKIQKKVRQMFHEYVEESRVDQVRQVLCSLIVYSVFQLGLVLSGLSSRFRLGRSESSGRKNEARSTGQIRFVENVGAKAWLSTGGLT